MNRNMDVIRQIIIAVRDSEEIVKNVDGVSDDNFKFNTMLLIEAGLVLGKIQPNSRSHSPVPNVALIFRLTWEGFDFADSIEDDDIWTKAKKHILKPSGSWTFGILDQN